MTLNALEVGAWTTALRTAALVGTSRRAPSHAPAALGSPPEDTEALLDQAALFDILDRAGARAVVGVPVDPAPPETRAYAPPEAMRLLSLILHQPPLKGELRDELILAWLGECGAANAIVAPGLLPELADFAMGKISARPALSNCWGERGRWLAEAFHRRLFNASVASRNALADTVPPEEVDDLIASWPTLDTAAASLQLRRLRLTDPDRARDLLAEHWPTLAAKARNEHLLALSETLTLADDDFLENALDDRAKSVREVAVKVLTGLHGSRHSRRMAARLAPLIHVEKRLLRPAAIRLTLPQEVDEAGIRDGLSAPDPATQGQTAEWLAAMIVASPMDVWTGATGLTPGAVVAALDLTEAERAAFDRAIGHSGDSEWADAVAADTTDPQVVATMSPTVRDTWLRDRIALRSEANRLVFDVLRAIPRPWPPDLSETVIARLGESEDGTPFLNFFGVDLIAGLGPETVPQVRQLLARPVKDPDKQANTRGKLLTIMQFHSLKDSIRDAFASAKETP